MIHNIIEWFFLFDCNFFTYRSSTTRPIVDRLRRYTRGIRLGTPVRRSCVPVGRTSVIASPTKAREKIVDDIKQTEYNEHPRRFPRGDFLSTVRNNNNNNNVARLYVQADGIITRVKPAWSECNEPSRSLDDRDLSGFSWPYRFLRYGISVHTTRPRPVVGLSDITSPSCVICAASATADDDDDDNNVDDNNVGDQWLRDCVIIPRDSTWRIRR